MTDDHRPPPTAPRRPAGPPGTPSRLELIGWAILVSGLLVLVYFALTRPT